MIKNILNGKFLNKKQLYEINFKKIGENVLIDKNVLIPNPERITIGNNVRIDTNCILSAAKNSEIILKNNIHIAPLCILYSASKYKIILENHSGLAAGCKLYGRTENYDGRFLMNPTHFENDLDIIRDNIILKKYATLGCDTILFPGSIIPEGTVIGSKSLYTGKKPLKDWAVYAGAPIKLIKYRNKNCKELSKKYN
jgi:acetyltransferase-like isoleucine patch superfamily enzyme